MIPFPKGKYSVIYADPPWNYKQGGNGSAKKHYETMTTEDLCKLPVRDICTDNAVLFMWATFPNIKEALKVMEAWGFIYKTVAFVWVKKNKKSDTLFMGTGSYTRANAEVCLLGISKKTKASDFVASHSVHQIILEPIRDHSQKPDEARNRIYQLTGGEQSYIELFARSSAPGWSVWGKEVDKYEI